MTSGLVKVTYDFKEVKVKLSFDRADQRRTPYKLAAVIHKMTRDLGIDPRIVMDELGHFFGSDAAPRTDEIECSAHEVRQA